MCLKVEFATFGSFTMQLILRPKYVAKVQIVGWWFLAGLAGSLFVLALVVFFWQGFATNLNSDAAVPALLAARSLATSSILPADWYYENDDLWILTPQILSLPFVAVFGVSSTALALGNFVGLVCIVAVFAALAHRLTGRWPVALALAFCAASLFSDQQLSFVYTQFVYGMITIKLALLMILVLRLVQTDAEGARSRWLSLSALCYVLLLMVLSAENPLRAIAFWCLPITVVCFSFDRVKLSWQTAISIVSVTLASTAVGALIHFMLRSHLLVNGGMSNFALRPISQWGHNLGLILDGLPSLVGYGLGGLVSPTPVIGLALLRVVFFMGVIGSTVFVLRHIPDRPEQALFSRFAALLLLTSVGLLTIGNMMVTGVSVRYLLPAALLGLISFMVSLQSRFRYGVRAWLIAAAMVAAFCGAMVITAVSTVAAGKLADCSGPAGPCALAKEMNAQHLDHGFATYWNANVTTIVSKSSVVVCGILLAPHISPFRWLVSRDCYDPENYTGDYFYAFTKEEASALNRAQFQTDAGVPTSTIQTGDYEVWIYRIGSERRLDWLKH
jgi:hypothetical protein